MQELHSKRQFVPFGGPLPASACASGGSCSNSGNLDGAAGFSDRGERGNAIREDLAGDVIVVFHCSRQRQLALAGRLEGRFVEPQ